jgi:undecaprenyl diphosphate synthase
MTARKPQYDTSLRPVHVAIIMDGNRRWARQRRLPSIAGHRRGVVALRRTVKACREMGISWLTLFAFSTENWNRPKAEVRELLRLLRYYLRKEVPALSREGVRIRFIGERQRFPADIVALLEQSEATTRHNRALTLTVALDYGARREILTAAQRIGRDVAKGLRSPDSVNEDVVAGYLFTAGLPDPNLLIRTSGEQRISNFLLWQLAETELVFTPTLWPDFSRAELEAAIAEFQRRAEAARAIQETTQSRNSVISSRAL